jgi:tetratricopeptide (TPR) repeat protein
MRWQVARFVLPAVFAFLVVSYSIAQDTEFAMPGNPQEQAARPWANDTVNAGMLSGVVRIANGAPVGGASVELLSTSTGQPIASTVTLPNGGFVLNSVPAGEYEIRVSAENVRSESNLHMDPGGLNGIQINLPSAKPGTGESKDSVALSELQAPEKARKELDKARERFGQQRYDEAEQHADAALRIWPDYPAALSMRGVLLIRKGETQAAIGVLQHALTFDPMCVTCYVALADIFNNQQQFADARRTVEQALKSAPSAWQLHFELGKALTGMGDFQGALKEFTRAQESAPARFEDIHFMVGWVAASLGSLQRAELELTEFLKAKVKGPFTLQAQKLLANVQLMQMQQAAISTP